MVRLEVTFDDNNYTFDQCFNSRMVRLEAPKQYASPPALSFQFQDGAIRGLSIALSASILNACFNSKMVRLEVYRDADNAADDYGFNSKMVRLEESRFEK